MDRILSWALAAVVLSAAPVAGNLFANTGSEQAARAAAARAAEERAVEERTYLPVAAETLGTTGAVGQLMGAYVKVADYFYEEVGSFPDDALRQGKTPQTHYAFRTRPYGSNLICFVALDNPDAKALREGRPLRGAAIYLMGRVGPRILVANGLATQFDVDRVVFGHEAPAPKTEKKKPVVLVIERVGPRGIQKQEFLIPNPGVRYRIPDPLEPANESKAVYVTLQF